MKLLKKARAWLRHIALRVMYPNVDWGKGARIWGLPRIFLNTHGKIVVGNNVFLHSKPRGYHAGMSFPVTLIADRPSAIIRIGEETRLFGSCLHAWQCIEIGKRCLFAAGSQVLDSDGHESRVEYAQCRARTQDKPDTVRIGDDCWVGLNAIILKGADIKEGCIVAAGAVVRKGHYPPYSLIAGVPARVVKTMQKADDRS